MVGRVEILLSLVESFIELKYLHSVATPALLYHKEPSRRIQSPPTRALERNCLTLVLYGISDAGKGPIMGALGPERTSKDLGPDLGSLQSSTLPTMMTPGDCQGSWRLSQ